MTPQQFKSKWQGQKLKERQGYQQHFLDLCDLVGHQKPAEIDKAGESFCFERGATKTGGGNGWADVWKRGFFAIEYKGPEGSLAKALQQVQRYALALENPPLLVVSDLETIQIHTNFTNTVSEVHTIALEEIDTPVNIAKLKWLFSDPERLRPSRTIDEVTATAAEQVAGIAAALHASGHEPHRVAHFLNQCVFCCYAEDVGLLPDELFTRLLESCRAKPAALPSLMTSLFQAMGDGGYFGADEISWFNGGLFSTIEVIELPLKQIDALLDASRMDWGHINPSIFGTLFERGLDPAKRSQLGAHYTDIGSISRILGPVIEEPLLDEWATLRVQVAKQLELWHKGGKGSKIAGESALAAYQGFLERLRLFRVLDPACGSGNFLYLSLRMLKDIQHRVMLDGETLGLHYDIASLVGPEAVMGIELNPYAAELARVTIWIGEIQWMLDHGFQPSRNPILKTLDLVDCRDALLNEDGTEAKWPTCDVIVGNPPFLGGSKKRGELGDEYFSKLNVAFSPAVPGAADLVCYWFHKAHQQISANACARAGLVSTNSVRGGTNRKVLDAIAEAETIFDAWRDEAWINEGAAVRVSIVCFGISNLPARNPHLDGEPVMAINSDLTSVVQGADLTKAKRLAENSQACFEGVQKNGPFEVPGSVAREWLVLPNVNGESNARVLRPYKNAKDVTGRPNDDWMVDFYGIAEQDAAHFEAPFKHILDVVKPVRDSKKEEYLRRRYWLLKRSAPDFRQGVENLDRYIITPRHAKHRLFVWEDARALPDSAVNAITRSDDATFGVLHSRFHELWALALCTFIGVGNDPRYTPTTTFGTFPFPHGLSPAETANKQVEQLPSGVRIPAALTGEIRAKIEAIAVAAFELDRLRQNWLNPPQWIRREPEVVSDFPDRVVPLAAYESPLKARTLTNLYNEPPAWLTNAHSVLDLAVAAAYGWADYHTATTDEELLSRLLAMNLARAQTLSASVQAPALAMPKAKGS